MTINEIQKDIIEDFSSFTEWMDKYEYLISLGKGLILIDEQHKTDEYLIIGCQSQVWLNATYENGKVKFYADSDAIITKGIIALLVKVLSNQAPQDIINANLFFIDDIGLAQNLSPTRANGLLAMIKQMKYFAMAYQAKENK